MKKIIIVDYVCGNILRCQFHPEKSGKNGLKIFKNFSKSIKSVDAEV